MNRNNPTRSVTDVRNYLHSESFPSNSTIMNGVSINKSGRIEFPSTIAVNTNKPDWTKTRAEGGVPPSAGQHVPGVTVRDSKADVASSGFFGKSQDG